MHSIPNTPDFHWSKPMYHFTFKSHHAINDLLLLCQRATSIPIKAWSYCHEVSDDGYEHTHFFVWYVRRLNLRGSRKFDVLAFDDDGNPEVYHPNVQSGLTIGHVETIMLVYHAGRKYDVTSGSVVYKEPVMYDYKLPADFSFNREIIEHALEAPSLREACILSEIRPKTVNDLKLLRDEAATAPKKLKPMYPRESFLPNLLPVDWSVVHVFGPSGIGKTKAMLVQFDNPCFIKPFDSIGCLESLMKAYDPKVHDGLVLDEVDLRFMKRAQVIALFDVDEPCTLDVRYKSFTLPAGLKKILISNPSPADLYPEDPYGAITRRVKIVHLTQPTYHVRAQPMQQVLTPMTGP